MTGVHSEVVDINSESGYNCSSLLENQMPLFKTDSELTEFLDFLGDLSIDGETFEICLSALKLQTALKEIYGEFLI